MAIPPSTLIMYFPYLRGKRYELEALLGVPSTVYNNTLPIIEPVNLSSRSQFQRLVRQNIPFILITNPQLPPDSRLPITTVQNSIIGSWLLNYNRVTLGLIIDHQSTLAELQAFLSSSSNHDTAVIFRHNPMPALMATFNNALQATPPTYIIFDDRCTSPNTQNILAWHSNKVLITDGFQRASKNANYPQTSFFDSNYSSFRANGWAGIGDYLNVGDYYREGGGQPYVVTLHMTLQTPMGLVVHHFSSTTTPTIPGGASQKFIEACDQLVNSPHIARANSTGISMYQNWHTNSHFPALGPPKQASMQHHIELMASIV